MLHSNGEVEKLCLVDFWAGWSNLTIYCMLLGSEPRKTSLDSLAQWESVSLKHLRLAVRSRQLSLSIFFLRKSLRCVVGGTFLDRPRTPPPQRSPNAPNANTLRFLHFKA